MKTLVLALALLFPSFAFAQEATPRQWPIQWPIRLAISVNTVVQSADLGVSNYAFGQTAAGGRKYREANVILRSVAGDPVVLSVAKMSLATGVNYGLFRLYQHKPKTAIALSVLNTIAVGYVTHKNAQLLGLR